jgi:hypothetical protein
MSVSGRFLWSKHILCTVLDLRVRDVDEFPVFRIVVNFDEPGGKPVEF